MYCIALHFNYTFTLATQRSLVQFQLETQIPLGKVVSGRASSIKLCQSKHVEWLAVGSGKIHFILATLLCFNSYFHSKCWIHQQVRVNVIIYVHNNTDTVLTWHLKRKKWKKTNLNLENNENNIFHVSKWLRLTKYFYDPLITVCYLWCPDC